MTHDGSDAGEPIRVMIVDDHPMWLGVLDKELGGGEQGSPGSPDARSSPEARSSLGAKSSPDAPRGLGARFEVVATADTGRKALRLVAAARPDVVVLDLNLPDLGGVEVIRGLLAVDADLHILMLSASGEERDVLDAVKAGATGYLVKSASADEFRSAVELTAQGEPVFNEKLAGVVLGEFQRLARLPADPGREKLRLTEREKTVLEYVATGMTSRQIGAELCISPRTVENHIQNTLSKLHLHSRVELALYAVEHGIRRQSPPAESPRPN